MGKAMEEGEEMCEEEHVVAVALPIAQVGREATEEEAKNKQKEKASTRFF